MLLIEENFELLDRCKADSKIGKVGNLEHNCVLRRTGGVPPNTSKVGSILSDFIAQERSEWQRRKNEWCRV
jgi:hypothetical protein